MGYKDAAEREKSNLTFQALIVRSCQPCSVVTYLDRSRWLFPTIRGMCIENSDQQQLDELNKLFFWVDDFDVGGRQ